MTTEYFAQSFDEIPNKISEHGICIIDNFISQEIINVLALEIQNLQHEASLQQAGTGAGIATVNQALRGDYIAWLNDNNSSDPQDVYFTKMEALRLNLNAHLYLGLFGLESHLALYPAGSGYKKHIDRFKNRTLHDGKPVRQISCILYLNANWKDAFGGQLRVYTNDSTFDENYFDILPIGGRLVTFLSDTFYHEVLPATQDRMSITGWFLTR